MPGGPKPKQTDKTTPLKGIPDPPKGLSAAARQHWHEVAGLMDRAGLCSLLDYDALSVYVSVWSQWREAEAEIKASGAVYPGPNSYLIMSPWQKIRENCQKEMRAFFDVFGLSPKARSSITISEPKPVTSKWVKPETLPSQGAE